MGCRQSTRTPACEAVGEIGHGFTWRFTQWFTQWLGWRSAGLQGGTPLWNSLRMLAWTGYWAILAWIVGRVLVLLI